MKKRMLLIGLSALFLNACTDNGLLFRSDGEYDSQSFGMYFVGEPYEVKGRRYVPAETDSYKEKGMASWYTLEKDFSVTANGELFDDTQMTARHKTLPLPSLVRITNLENGNTAIVRVNDRGPFVNNRLIDVSLKTAEALEFQNQGTTMVEVELLVDESRLMKQELVAAGRVEEPVQTETVSETAVSSESVDISDPAPIYAPENPAAGQMLYAPDAVSTVPLVEASDAPVADKSAADEVYAREPVDLTQPEVAGSVTEETLTVTQEVVSAEAVSSSVVAPAPVVAAPVESLEATKAVTQMVAPSQENIVSSKQSESVTPAPRSFSDAQDLASMKKYYVQMGAFSKKANAEQIQKRLSGIVDVSFSTKKVGDKELTVVRTQPFLSKKEARRMLDQIKKAGYTGSQIVTD